MAAVRGKLRAVAEAATVAIDELEPSRLDDLSAEDAMLAMIAFLSHNACGSECLGDANNRWREADDGLLEVDDASRAKAESKVGPFFRRRVDIENLSGKSGLSARPLGDKSPVNGARCHWPNIPTSGVFWLLSAPFSAFQRPSAGICTQNLYVP